MERIIVKTTKKREVVDITDLIAEKVEETYVGFCSVFIAHTTAALTTADLDPGTDEDLLDAIDAMIPKLKYRHPHDPSHAPDHIASSLIGTSINIPIENGNLLLGEWQRIVLVEFDGPRKREIFLEVTGKS